MLLEIISNVRSTFVNYISLFLIIIFTTDGPMLSPDDSVSTIIYVRHHSSCCTVLWVLTNASCHVSTIVILYRQFQDPKDPWAPLILPLSPPLAPNFWQSLIFSTPVELCLFQNVIQVKASLLIQDYENDFFHLVIAL